MKDRESKIVCELFEVFDSQWPTMISSDSGAARLAKASVKNAIIDAVKEAAKPPAGFVLAPEHLTTHMRGMMSSECSTHFGKLDAMYEAAINAAKEQFK